VNEWFFGGTTDNWLAALRIGLGLQLVLYCIISSADWRQMFALDPGSFVTRDLTEALVTLGSTLVPRVSWFISAGEFIGLSEATVLWVVWSVLLAGYFVEAQRSPPGSFIFLQLRAALYSLTASITLLPLGCFT